MSSTTTIKKSKTKYSLLALSAFLALSIFHTSPAMAAEATVSETLPSVTTTVSTVATSAGTAAASTTALAATVTTVKTVTAVPKVLTAAQKKAAAKKAAAKKAAAIKAKKKAKAKAKRAKIIKIAKKYRGVRYVFGGASPAAGFDCSGYTKYVYKKAINMTLPHSANGQAHKGRKVSAKNAKAGDLVIYSYPYSANFHVAIYVSKNKTIAAQKPGRVTGITNLFWGSGESHKYVDVIDPSVGL